VAASFSFPNISCDADRVITHPPRFMLCVLVLVCSGGKQYCGVRSGRCKKTRSCLNWSLSRWNHCHRCPHHHSHGRSHQRWCHLHLHSLRSMLQSQRILRWLLLFRGEKWQLLLLRLIHDARPVPTATAAIQFYAINHATNNCCSLHSVIYIIRRTFC